MTLKNWEKKQIWPISWLNFFFPKKIRMIKHHKPPGPWWFSQKNWGETSVKNWGNKPLTPGTWGSMPWTEMAGRLCTSPPRRLALRGPWGFGSPNETQDLAAGKMDGMPANVRGWWNLRCPEFKFMDVFDAYGNYLLRGLWSIVVRIILGLCPWHPCFAAVSLRWPLGDFGRWCCLWVCPSAGEGSFSYVALLCGRARSGGDVGAVGCGAFYCIRC